MTGVMAYLSAPLWFLFLALSTALVAVQTLSPPQYFQNPHQLFPIWPEWHPEWAIALFSATATLLFLPKILSVLLVILKGSREYGGPLPLLGSLFIEMLFSALLAPIRMLFHTQFVTAAFLGITIQWKSPPREDSATPWSEAIARHGPGTALGILWAAGIYHLNAHYLWWLLPIVGSLILAVPLSVWSSRSTLGRAFKKPRLFLIPEESHTPRELRWTRLGVKKAGEPSDFRRAVVDPVSNAVACAYANPRERLPAAVVSARLRLVAAALKDGPNSLTAIQKNTLIHDPVALSNLHFQVWTDKDAHPDWKKG
jgi:membrane glycosyltransferase